MPSGAASSSYHRGGRCGVVGGRTRFLLKASCWERGREGGGISRRWPSSWSSRQACTCPRRRRAWVCLCGVCSREGVGLVLLMPTSCVRLRVAEAEHFPSSLPSHATHDPKTHAHPSTHSHRSHGTASTRPGAPEMRGAGPAAGTGSFVIVHQVSQSEGPLKTPALRGTN